MSCKVSVIMPVYNAEKYLKESIGDILLQSLKEFELICVDDGSTDASRSLIEEYARGDCRVRLLTQKNQGAGAARNLGLCAAEGKYLLFLDADDRFEQDMLECAFEKAEKTSAQVVMFKGDRFDALTKKRMAHSGLLEYETYKECFDEDGRIKQVDKNNIVYSITNSTVWNKLFLHEFVKENALRFQEIYGADTMYFVMSALASASDIVVLDRLLVHYRANTPGGQISNQDKTPTAIYEAGVEVKKYLDENRLYDVLETAFLNYMMKSCMLRFQFFHTLDAEKTLYKVLHEGGLRKLGMREDNIEKISDRQCRDRVHRLMKLSYEEYLEEKIRTWKENKLIVSDMYLLPEFSIADGDKVVLYGAGFVGKSYYTQIQYQGKWKLQGWVDKEYLKCGYPVLNPEEIRNWDVDAVIVAIADKGLVARIKQYLCSMGIDENKVFWDVPKQIG